MCGIAGVETSDQVHGLFAGNVHERLRVTGAGQVAVRDALRRVSAALLGALPGLRSFPLVPQVLEELGETRHIVIVSSNTEAAIRAFHERHHIAGVAEVAGEEAGESKTAKIEQLIARHPGQEVYWFVGDTAGDMREARLAGAMPVGVSWGRRDPALLWGAGAEAVADTPVDLLAIVAPELTHDVPGLSA